MFRIFKSYGWGTWMSVEEVMAMYFFLPELKGFAHTTGLAPRSRPGMYYLKLLATTHTSSEATASKDVAAQEGRRTGVSSGGTHIRRHLRPQT